MKKLWKCSVCGYVHEGDEAPEVCPKCDVTKEKFVELSKEDTEKIYNSDPTNDLYTKIIAMMQELHEMCQEGMDKNLDPNCVKTFDRAKNYAWIIKQMCKAELEGHMKKGKW